MKTPHLNNIEGLFTISKCRVLNELAPKKGYDHHYIAWNFQLSMQKTQPDDTVNSIFKKKFKHLGKERVKAQAVSSAMF
jgi:hypothetical protein